MLGEQSTTISLDEGDHAFPCLGIVHFFQHAQSQGSTVVEPQHQHAFGQHFGALKQIVLSFIDD